MSGVEATSGYDERATCYVCGKRRLCRFFKVGYPFGIGWMVCRWHGDWQPKEGRDYWLSPSPEETR